MTGAGASTKNLNVFADERPAACVQIVSRAGDPDPQGNAERVYALEKRIAEGHWDKVDNRDPIKTYNAKSVAQLTKLAPGVDWTCAASSRGVRNSRGGAPLPTWRRTVQ